MAEHLRTVHRDYVFTQDDFPLAINWNRYHPDYPLHRHDFEELVVVKQGTGINSVDGVDYPLQAGDVFIMPQGKAHAYSHMDRLRSYNVYFDATQLGLRRWVARSLPGFQALFIVEPSYRRKKEFNSRLRLEQEQLLQVWSLAESLDATLAEKEPGFRLIALGKFMELVGLLCRYYEVTPQSEDSSKVLRIAKAISHMEEHFSMEVTTEKLAEIAHMSARNFHRVFVGATGKTPAAYLIGLRIGEAARQLDATDRTITEIAFDCGFSDSNYFARAFRKTMGKSPTSFRKRYRR